MANELTLPITPGQLPQGFCPSTEQERLNTYANVSYVTFPSTFSGVILSQSKPTDTTKAWGQLDQYGRFLRLYNYANGLWVSLHPGASGLTQWWFNDLPNLNTFDGGDANPISDTSGPMWQQAKNKDGVTIAAKFPIAAGTLPSTTVLNVGDTGGEEKHILTQAELPNYELPVRCGGLNLALSAANNFWSGDGGNGNGFGQGDSRNFGQAVEVKSGGSGTAFNELPLYVVGYLLQRTSRLFYAVS